MLGGRWWAQDDTRGCPVRVQFASSVGQATLGGGDASSNVNDLPLAVHRSRLRRDRSQVVDLELERGKGRCSGEHGLYSATERRVQ